MNLDPAWLAIYGYKSAICEQCGHTVVLPIPYQDPGEQLPLFAPETPDPEVSDQQPRKLYPVHHVLNPQTPVAPRSKKP